MIRFRSRSISSKMRALMAGAILMGSASASDAEFASRNEFEILAYRAPQPLDWSTPGGLTRTAFWNTQYKIGNSYYPHAISHMNIKLQCQGQEPIYRGIAGTKPRWDYLKDFVLWNSSLDVLLKPTTGRFYTNEDIEPWLRVLKPMGYVRSLKLVLSDVQCSRLQTYLAEYEKYELQTIYGSLMSDPLRGEGAGCSAFALSFLQTLGIMPSEFQSWKRQLKIPRDLITTNKTSASIGFLSFLAGRSGAWAKDNEPAFKVDFWDPELMYTWIQDVIDKKKAFSSPFEVENKNGLVSIIWDVRQQRVPASSPWAPLQPGEISQNLKRVREGLNQYLPELWTTK